MLKSLMPVRLIQKEAYVHKENMAFSFFCYTKEIFYEKLNLNKSLSDQVFQIV